MVIAKKMKWFILLVAVSFVLIGTIGNEPSIVMTKAVNICLECIGIG